MIESTDPQLPPGRDCVAELVGDCSIARVRSGTEGELADWLTDAGIDWYTPRQAVRKWYKAEKGSDRLKSRTWSRAFIPGIVFVFGGIDGRLSSDQFRSRYSNHLYGWIGHIYGGAIGRQLVRELQTIESLLRIDPTLSASEGIRRGVAVRVTSGPFAGYEGIVDDHGNQGRFTIVLKTLGQSIPVAIESGLLERLA